MDARPLPPRPDLSQYKKQAKELLRACTSGNPAEVQKWAAGWVEGWAAVWRATQSRLGVKEPDLETEIDRVEKAVRAGRLSTPGAKLADAQLFIAREHGFASWPKFSEHVGAIGRERSRASQFEAAVDAIVLGEAATLERLLREEPALIGARSDRAHRATLLHYVGSNGVEDYRQQTPTNAVAIARLLLAAGAEVNAVAEVYRSDTTLDLVATSVHPERAGVQLELLDVLLAAGAKLDATGSSVNACLRNGRKGAAAFLAERGARLDLEGAAGVGRLDLVREFFDAAGALRPTASRAQLDAGFGWACEFGRTEVVALLLPKVDGDAVTHGLHWAVYSAQPETLDLFLQRKVSLEARSRWGGTALGTAVWCARNAGTGFDYLPVVRKLLAAGADREAERGLAEEVDRLLARPG